jgi:hypothetical protein
VNQIHQDFYVYPWYKDIRYVLWNLQAPPKITKARARFVKLKPAKLCILNGYIYWKDLGGILLKYLLENEANEKIQEFQKGDCGGHLYWKATTYKVLRHEFYQPTLFTDIYKPVSSCHQCQIFKGRRKLLPLPLKLIIVEDPFQQWGLYFTGEINPASSGKNRWILTTTNYFTKWIEVIPTRQPIDTVIIEFLFDNIISMFGCPRKIITNNAQAFKSNKMIKFCSDYNIILAHSIVYYP